MVTNSRLKVSVGGEWIPYSDADWVIFNAAQFPVGFMGVEREDLVIYKAALGKYERDADERHAFKRFASGTDHDALTYALGGHYIALYRRDTDEWRELLRKHLGTAS